MKKDVLMAIAMHLSNIDVQAIRILAETEHDGAKRILSSVESIRNILNEEIVKKMK